MAEMAGMVTRQAAPPQALAQLEEAKRRLAEARGQSGEGNTGVDPPPNELAADDLDTNVDPGLPVDAPPEPIHVFDSPQDSGPPSDAGSNQLQARLDEALGRLATLQERFVTEVPRLTDQVLTLQQTIRERDLTIAELSSRPVAQAPEKELTDEELVARYGLSPEDLDDRTTLDIIRKVAAGEARKAAEDARAASSKEFAGIRERLEAQSEERFEARVIERIPEWGQLQWDDNPVGKPFMAWLKTGNGHWSRTLNAAYRNQDLDGVVEVVQAYRAMSGLSGGGGNGPRGNGAGVQRPDVASQVTPGSRGNAPRPQNAGKPVYSPEDWVEFCTKLTQMRPGTAAHKAQYEEYQAALREGRVRKPGQPARR